MPAGHQPILASDLRQCALAPVEVLMLEEISLRGSGTTLCRRRRQEATRLQFRE